MIPSLFEILNASATVKALLGTAPLRVFPYGAAPDKVVKPYATYGVINGQPENYLGQVPDIDLMGTQVDVWADTVASSNTVADAIRDALEPHAHMTNFSGNERDAETKLFRCRMEFDFFEAR